MSKGNKRKFKRVLNKNSLVKLNPNLNFELQGITVNYITPITIRQRERIETLLTMFKINGVSDLTEQDEDSLMSILEDNFDVFLPEGETNIHIVTLLSLFSVFVSKLSIVEEDNKKK